MPLREARNDCYYIGRVGIHLDGAR
jgi:hypothetical protein